MQEFKKADYVIYARYAYPGDSIHNYLEGSDYVTSDDKPIVLSGTAEEEWTVTMDKLMNTYTFEDGSAITPEDFGYRIPQSDDEWVAIRPIQDYSAPTIFAYQTNPGEQVEVATSWGEILTANRPGVPHGDGDWIVFANDGYGNPDENDSWIVNGEIFDATYEEV